MKTLAILLMLLTLFLMVGFGVFYLLGFAMSFDAPGSTSDPKAWGMRLLFFAPILIFLVVLILSWQAYASGNFRKSVLLGVTTPAICVALYLWMFITSMSSMKVYNDKVANDKEMEAKYPVQNYMRQTSLGTDTIIVWPTGIVAYRLNVEGMANIWGGPLGDLSEDRKTITYHHSSDTRLMPEELDQFTDKTGKKFTEVFDVK